MHISAFAAGLAVMSSLAAATTPLRLAPSTPWVLDYAENSCRLIRRFGVGKDLVIFALESEAPGSLDMLIAGNPMASSMDQVAAKFLPQQTKPTLGLPGESTENGQPLVLWSFMTLLPDDSAAAEENKQKERRAHPEIRPPAASLTEQAAKKALRQAFAASTTAIEVDGRVGRPVILETGSLGAAINVFDQCSRNSLRDWGVDPTIEDKIVRPVWAPNPGAWFNASDYPRGLILRGQESVVKVRVLVDATGRVTKCTSLSHFKEPEFNKIVCDRFTERARFEPAEFADGTKVPSYYVNKVVFRIGD